MSGNAPRDRTPQMMSRLILASSRKHLLGSAKVSNSWSALFRRSWPTHHAPGRCYRPDPRGSGSKLGSESRREGCSNFYLGLAGGVVLIQKLMCNGTTILRYKVLSNVKFLNSEHIFPASKFFSKVRISGGRFPSLIALHCATEGLTRRLDCSSIASRLPSY